MAWDSALEPHPLGAVIDHLVDTPPSQQRVVFSDPDINYLTRRYELEPRFVGRMLRIFGESVVREALRRFQKGWTTAVFVGICRNVERSG